jgi:hypothetical protein
MMVTAEEIVGPRGNLIQCPVTRRNIILSKEFLCSIRSETIISAYVNALLFPRKDFTPSFHRSSTLAVEEVLGALGLGAEKSHLQKRTVTAAPATGTDELDPVFHLCNRAFESGPIDLPEEPSGGVIKRSLWRKGQTMEKPHDHVSDGLSRMASFVPEYVCVKTCPRIFLKKIKTILLWKRELLNILLPIWSELLRLCDHLFYILVL